MTKNTNCFDCAHQRTDYTIHEDYCDLGHDVTLFDEYNTHCDDFKAYDWEEFVENAFSYET